MKLLILISVLFLQANAHAKIKNQWELCFDVAFEIKVEEYKKSGDRRYINFKGPDMKMIEQDAKVYAKDFCVGKGLLAPEEESDEPKGKLTPRNVVTPEDDTNDESGD